MELVSRRQDVAFALAKFSISQRRACELLQIDRSSCRYQRRPERDPEIKQHVVEIATTHPRYGYRRVTAVLKRAGRHVNRKRVWRWRKELGVQVRRKARKRLQRTAPAAQTITAADQLWAMDFVSDAAANGQTLRALTVIDVHTRECLAIEVATSICSRRVARVFLRSSTSHGRKLLWQGGGALIAPISAFFQCRREGHTLPELDFVPRLRCPGCDQRSRVGPFPDLTRRDGVALQRAF